MQVAVGVVEMDTLVAAVVALVVLVVTQLTIQHLEMVDLV
jgi:hypothetical protein